MRKTCFLSVFVLFSLTVAACRPPSQSPMAYRPLGYDKAALLQLRADGFVIEDVEQRARMATALLHLLGAPDPVLRDKIAYEAYTTWLRGKLLPAETIRQLRSALIELLTAPDDEGFRRPFAALVLAEVARSDRIDPLFSGDERTEMISAATAYMQSIDDYRGFSEVEGWRHGVAHTADLFMQLALNPALSRTQLMAVREGVADRIVPTNAHFYIYGESGRLARPILFIALRNVFTAQEWAEWFDRMASPAPMSAWNEAYSSQAGLAKLHNTRAFAQALFVRAAGDDARLAPIRDGASAILRKLP